VVTGWLAQNIQVGDRALLIAPNSSAARDTEALGAEAAPPASSTSHARPASAPARSAAPRSSQDNPQLPPPSPPAAVENKGRTVQSEPSNSSETSDKKRLVARSDASASVPRERIVADDVVVRAIRPQAAEELGKGRSVRVVLQLRQGDIDIPN